MGILEHNRVVVEGSVAKRQSQLLEWSVLCIDRIQGELRRFERRPFLMRNLVAQRGISPCMFQTVRLVLGFF
jgi:hypothetical protein